MEKNKLVQRVREDAENPFRAGSVSYKYKS
jgi:hypothetical protein